MPTKRLKFKKELCIGCQLCMQACSGTHEGAYAPALARLQIETYYDKGGDIKFDKHTCVLCGRCAKECPENAITLEEKLILAIESCNGCGICADICPQKVIRIRDEKAVLCDTCDGDPWCVKMCPHGALSFE